MTPLTIATKDGSKKERLLVITGSVKPSGMIVARVTTDKGDDYFVRLYTDGREECGCPGNREWKRQCYHIKEVAARKGEFPRMSDMVAPKPATKVRKPRTKFVPDLTGLQLPAGQKMRKVRGKSQLVIAVKQETVAPVVVEEAVAEKPSEAHHIIDEQEVIPATPQAPQWSNRPLTMDERIAASRKESEKRSQAPLNGNRGFSLWR